MIEGENFVPEEELIRKTKEKSSQSKSFRDKERQEILDIPEVLSGSEVADIAKECYAKAPNLLGPKLVESNIVLTLAGLKGATEFFIPLRQDMDEQTIDKEISILNSLLEERGINFDKAGKPFMTKEGLEKQMVGIINLRGLERVSKMTNIPGVEEFDSNQGFSGEESWRLKTINNLKKNQLSGLVPYKDKRVVGNIFGGLERGYPDVAIMDFVDWIEHGRKKEISNSNISLVGTYVEAEPNYSFYSEHTDDDSVQKNIKQAELILKGFYQSSWHIKRTKSLKFREARRKVQ